MNQYVRIATVRLEQGLETILSGDSSALHNVGTSSLRLKTFAAKGTCCKYCGLKATHFAIEKCQGSKLDIYHMNLWGWHNESEILFTHDHIQARSLGGADDINNSVTACETCNSRKSRFENKIFNYLGSKQATISFDDLIDTILKIWHNTNSQNIEDILKFFLVKI